jgi:hypothetical protein
MRLLVELTPKNRYVGGWNGPGMSENGTIHFENWIVAIVMPRMRQQSK